jgi:hypothetical protein
MKGIREAVFLASVNGVMVEAAVFAAINQRHEGSRPWNSIATNIFFSG